jgi:hypothetical protein
LKSAVLLLAVLQQTAYQGDTVESPQQRAEKVFASELDADLPAIPIKNWIRATVKPDDESQWQYNGCPATHEQWVETVADRPVCVLIKVGRGAKIWDVEQARATKDAVVVAVSIRLGRGSVSPRWQLEQPQLEDAFIERDGDSLTLQRLADLPRFLDVSPERWPKSELIVAASDVRCDKSPMPGETGRCQATIFNRGSIEALARISVSAVPVGTDVGLGQALPLEKIAPNSQVVVAWGWVWPQGSAWGVGVWVDLHTPHAYGGYRIPIKERNTQDNRAYVNVPARK